jgi:putative flippase GtrA
VAELANPAGGEPAASPQGSPIGRFFRQSPVRYLLAGALSFLVDFGLLALLHEIFGWPVWLASGCSFLLSFVFTYSIQRVYSFGSRVPHGRALIKYSALVALNTLATIVIVALINQSVLSWAGGKIIATAVTTAWNYFAYKYWVFADNPPRTRATRED